LYWLDDRVVQNMEACKLKKTIRLLSVLLVMIFSTFSFSSKMLFQTVEATYVEGFITQDTTWTLVDSPFIVSNDIVVNPGAKLTIEPGVEVRFGGKFFLNVSGKLYANGTDKTIKFTSNRKQSIAGDWGAIKFDGTEKSEIVGCVLAYGTDGIIVENGNLEIEDTNISLCSRNGITVLNGKLTVKTCNVKSCSHSGIDATNSELTVQDSTIMENGGNGIVITGNQQVTIRRNTIIANEKGILLTGNEVSMVNIRQNVISANKENGLQLDADNHANLVILYNSISSNYRGFYFASPTSTSINNNTISYNTGVGIFYEKGSHSAHFNDIYGNELGMDVSSDATVAAEHNYWGHESGPYNEILNPDGRGDPVGGDGVNLDFIFFLTNPYSHINVRPTATLYTDRTLVPPNGTVMFFAADSFDEGRIDLYLYDFGDGNTSGWTPLSIFTYQYVSQRVYNVSVTVMDDFGATSINNANATIDVQDLQPLYVNIDTSVAVVYEGEQILITVHVTDGTSSIENAKVELFSLKGGDFTESIGYTNSTGYFTTTFTAPDVTYLTNIRIVAKASESGYTDGSSYEDLESLPSLSVQVEANPNTIKSEETTQVTIYVKSNEQTVADAAVSISSNTGNLSTTAGFTNPDGIFSLDFTAPQTTDFTNANIVAVATKNEHLDGMGETMITVEPKVLVVHVTAQPNITSDASINISVHVEYDTPISDANVNLTSESFSATGLTDMYGDVTFVYTAPQVNATSNIIMTAWASKDKYADGYDQLQITASPGILDVQVEIDNPMVGSGESTVISVYVTCNGTPIEGSEVTMSANYGIFSVSTGNTDSEGYCEFVFEAPRTTVQLNATTVASATKNGYVDGRGQTIVTVTADLGGGWPLMTILLIIIPIVIAVIIVVLVKLKIIAFSTEEES